MLLHPFAASTFWMLLKFQLEECRFLFSALWWFHWCFRQSRRVPKSGHSGPLPELQKCKVPSKGKQNHRSNRHVFQVHSSKRRMMSSLYLSVAYKNFEKCNNCVLSLEEWRKLTLKARFGLHSGIESSIQTCSAVLAEAQIKCVTKWTINSISVGTLFEVI